MKTLILAVARAITRARLQFAENDLIWLHANTSIHLAEQHAHVLALAEKLDTLEAGLCNPCPAGQGSQRQAVTSEDVRARAERRAKEVLL